MDSAKEFTASVYWPIIFAVITDAGNSEADVASAADALKRRNSSVIHADADDIVAHVTKLNDSIDPVKCREEVVAILRDLQVCGRNGLKPTEAEVTA